MREAVIIGGGPGGAGAALGFKGVADRIIVYEANDRLAVKPCGRGIPVLGDIPIRIPRDVVYHRIRRAVMYVDGDPLFDMEGVFDGYIVDKAGFLESVFSEAGADIVYNAKYDPRRGEVKTSRGRVRVDGGVFAGGHPYYTGDKILAIQYRIKTRHFDEADHLEIYFDTGILGYYYIFPAEPGTVDVGVGGFKDFESLKSRLDRFIKRDERLQGERVKLEGARIAVGGLKPGAMNGLTVVGEAAGFVLPLTGEGIRPSMLSGIAAVKAIVSGGDPVEALKRTPIARAIEVQSRILETVKRMPVEERRALLKGLPARVHAEIALGRMDKGVIARELARKPGLALKLLRLL
ncbi:MAG: NAD(P)/FAD-dependent oxidoreductase [Desulfurococcales archaeon]|nr:NAD(P)/FAD-dependent oxidoreductase [Desulfurococcales archaeon]